MGNEFEADPMRKVVITGAAGLIGTVLEGELGDHYEIVGIDRAPRRVTNVRRVDMRRPRALAYLFSGAEAVIDLAALPSDRTPWGDVWRNNLPATMNALEAARQAGVRRIVFASSNHVTGMYEREPPYSSIVAGAYAGLDPAATPLIAPTWPVRPDGAYALGKVLGEAAARHYADAYGLSAVCLRIGTVNPENRPLEPRHFATLLTHRDLVRLVEAALAAPEDLTYGVYYGVSDNKWRLWDITNAREELRYEPLDNAETFR
jgi:nucleoside-diphosphate-sugar epimerase